MKEEEFRKVITDVFYRRKIDSNKSIPRSIWGSFFKKLEENRQKKVNR
jgi:hypothetical protein